MNNLYPLYIQDKSQKPISNKLDEKTVAKDTQRFFREIIKNTETKSNEEASPSPSQEPTEDE